MKYIIILLIALSSCVSTRDVMNSYVFHSKNYLLQNMGLPDRTGTDAAGGEILLYAKQMYIPSTTIYNAYGPNVHTQSHVYWDLKYFYINADGVVYNWRIERSQVPPMQVELYIR